jgi:hypothetical protein
MRAHVRTTFVFASFLIAGDAAANASISESPVRVKQTYSEGSHTELGYSSCTLDGVCTYVFRIHDRHGNAKIRFQLPEGYRSSGIDEYSYWDYRDDDHFALAFPVNCTAADVAYVSADNDNRLDCRVMLDVKGNQLQTTTIVIDGEVGGRYVNEYRRVGASPSR